MFILPLQHITVTELPHWMTAACAVSAKFNSVILLFWPKYCRIRLSGAHPYLVHTAY